MSTFEIVVAHWLAREHGDAIARATLGQLELRVGDRSLTLLEDRLARANRPFANLSAYDLAMWFATNWWRLRWEPQRADADWRMAHSLAAVGAGYVWPNIITFSDGDQISLESYPTGGAKWEPVRYLERWDCKLSAAKFEAAIDAFIEEVLARLAGCEIFTTELHTAWQELRAERSEAGIASIRKLEALLGFDAGAAPDKIIDDLLSEAEKDGRTAIDEIAAGFGRSAPQTIKEVAESLDQHGMQLRSDCVEDLASRHGASATGGLPWERAYEAAHIARDMWNLDGRPVQDAELTQLVGAEPRWMSEPASASVPMGAGKWTSPSRETWRVVLRSRVRVARRFQLCRLIGDTLIAPRGELLLPATDAKTSRQKFQRAFAQEFLCPFDALRGRLRTSVPGDEDIEEAAEYFEVSPLVVRHTLVNKGILPRDSASEIGQGPRGPGGP